MGRATPAEFGWHGTYSGKRAPDNGGRGVSELCEGHDLVVPMPPQPTRVHGVSMMWGMT